MPIFYMKLRGGGCAAGKPSLAEDRGQGVPPQAQAQWSFMGSRDWKAYDAARYLYAVMCTRAVGRGRDARPWHGLLLVGEG